MVFEQCLKRLNTMKERKDYLILTIFFFPCVSVGACSAVWALVGVLFFLNVVVAAVWYLNKSRQLQRYFKHTHTHRRNLTGHSKTV